MPGKEFVDSNILIYVHDFDADLKHKRAKDLLSKLWPSRSGRLSTQVLHDGEDFETVAPQRRPRSCAFLRSLGRIARHPFDSSQSLGNRGICAAFLLGQHDRGSGGGNRRGRAANRRPERRPNHSRRPNHQPASITSELMVRFCTHLSVPFRLVVLGKSRTGLTPLLPLSPLLPLPRL
jgi:hypothetical protein